MLSSHQESRLCLSLVTIAPLSFAASFDMNWADYVADMAVHEQVEQGSIRSTTLVGHPQDWKPSSGCLTC